MLVVANLVIKLISIRNIVTKHALKTARVRQKAGAFLKFLLALSISCRLSRTSHLVEKTSVHIAVVSFCNVVR